MFRYILTLVLFNTCHLSFGLPIIEKVDHIPIGNKLQALAETCENAVISNLIKSQIQRCNETSPSDIYLAPKCLIFFDINKQLCETFDKSKYDIQTDYSSKMKETQDVQSLCEKATSWKPKYLQEYPDLKLEKVFETEVLCVKLCANKEDIFSVDVNFFCKYYKWGFEAIKNATAPLPQISNEIDTGSKTVKPAVSLNNVGNPDTLPTLNKIDSSTPSKNDTESKQLEQNLPKIDMTKPNKISADATTIINHSSTNAAQKAEENPVKTEQSAASILPTAVKSEIEKPVVASEERDNKQSNDIKEKDNVIDNPKDDGIIEDDQEDDEEDGMYLYIIDNNLI